MYRADSLGYWMLKWPTQWWAELTIAQLHISPTLTFSFVMRGQYGASSFLMITNPTWRSVLPCLLS